VVGEAADASTACIRQCSSRRATACKGSSRRIHGLRTAGSAYERPNPLLAAVTALASGRGLGAEEVDEPEDEGHAAASSGGAPEDDEAEGEVDEEAGGHADAEMEAEAADGDELAAAEEGAVMGGGLAAQSDEDGVLGAVLGAVMDED